MRREKINQNLYPQEERNLAILLSIPQNDDKLLIQTVSCIEHMALEH